MKTRCSKCRFHEIGLTGDYAPRCAGKVGLKMRHDALTLLVARAFQKAGFDVKMEQNGDRLMGDDQQMLKSRIGLQLVTGRAIHP